MSLRGSHGMSLRGSHGMSLRGSHGLSLQGSHGLSLQGSHGLSLRESHGLSLAGSDVSLLALTAAPALAGAAAAWGVQSIPARIADLAVASRQRLPVGARQPVEIVDDLPVLHRELAHQPHRRVHTRAVHVHEPETALFEPE